MKNAIITKSVKLAIAIAAAAALNTPSRAAEETGLLTVSATVQHACAIGNATMNFGNVSRALDTASGTFGTTGDVNGTATVSVACTAGTVAAITANGGTSTDTSVRRMQFTDGTTTNYLVYELYKEDGSVWSLTNKISVTGTGDTQNVTLYGKIAGSAINSAKPGAYSDTVTMTIEYTP